MGAPSMSEDITERALEDLDRQQSEVTRAIEDAQMRLRVAKNYEAIAKAQKDVQNLAEQVAHHLDRTLADILASFDAVRAALRAPGAHLMRRLERLEKDNKDLKADKKTLQSNLQKARDSRDSLQVQVAEATTEIENLRHENRKLNTAVEGMQLWNETTSGAKKPINR